MLTSIGIVKNLLSQEVWSSGIGLCWSSDRKPHNLLHNAVVHGLSDDKSASRLGEWAAHHFGMTAFHPAGCDLEGTPRKDLWPLPEGTSQPPPEEFNPLVKRLMGSSTTQESLLEYHLLLSNKFNLHPCSDYCLKNSKKQPTVM